MLKFEDYTQCDLADYALRCKSLINVHEGSIDLSYKRNHLSIVLFGHRTLDGRFKVILLHPEATEHSAGNVSHSSFLERRSLIKTVSFCIAN